MAADDFQGVSVRVLADFLRDANLKDFERVVACKVYEILSNQLTEILCTLSQDHSIHEVWNGVEAGVAVVMKCHQEARKLPDFPGLLDELEGVISRGGRRE